VLLSALAGLSPPARDALGSLAGAVLGELARTRLEARQTCRLCDVATCGHHEGRCPVTLAVDARVSRP
jgi:hypothetical protein